MAGDGSCTGCGTPVAAGQRYCIACGLRTGAPVGALFVQNPNLPPAQATPLQEPHGIAKWLPVPPQMASAFGAMAIGFGVIIGTAISPNASVLSAAPAQLAAAPPAATAPLAPSTPLASTGGGAVPAAATGAATSSGSTGGGGGGGGGAHHKTKPQKQPPAATTIVGTVVHVNPAAGSYAVASGANLIAIHTDTMPNPGDQVSTAVASLYNGTYNQSGTRTTQGVTTSATLTGTVTYRDETALTYVVSSRGSSVLVHAPQSTAAQIPQLGAGVTVSVAIGASGPLTAPPPPPPPPLLSPPACDADGAGVPATPAPTTSTPLTQTALTVDPTPATSATLEGIVQAVCPTTGELVVSADDARESFSDLVLPVPAASGIDLSKVAVGQSFNVANAFDPTAKTFSVTGVSSDQGVAGANDASQAQGSLK